MTSPHGPPATGGGGGGSSNSASKEPRRLPPALSPQAHAAIPATSQVGDHPYNFDPSILAYPNLPHPTPKEQGAIDRLSQLLGEALQITIRDGRVYIGYLSMIDRDQNILLSQAEEFQPSPQVEFSRDDTSDLREKKVQQQRREEETRVNREMYWPRSEPSRPGGWGGREVGLALLNGRDIVKVETEEPWPVEPNPDYTTSQVG